MEIPIQKIPKIDYYELIQKRQRFIDFTKTKEQVFLTFITNHGIAENKYASEIIDAKIKLEDLINV